MTTTQTLTDAIAVPRRLDREAHPLSDQQMAIAQAVVVDGGDVVVRAKAGSGKTSTLEAVAHRFLHIESLQPERAKVRILYIAYNSSVQKEAQQRMPRNVESRTGHSLAWRWAGPEFTAKVKFDRNIGQVSHLAEKEMKFLRFRAKGVATALGLGSPMGADRKIIAARQAEIIMAVVNRFANSADDAIGYHHFRMPDGTDLSSKLSNTERTRLLHFANAYWDDIATPLGRGGCRFKANFDHLRKLWALSRPDLTVDNGAARAANVLFLDEAQDTPPVLGQVVDAQRGKMARIVVGDSDQAIYCQPLGTMVTVSKARDPQGTDCSVEGCTFRRGWIETGLCRSHQRQHEKGESLRLDPGRRKVGITTAEVRIEDLEVGDRVVTFTSPDSGVHMTGRPITAIERHAYRGDLVRVTTGVGESSAYTLKHHVVARMGAAHDDKHIVYLMRRGDRYRVGRTPMFYKSQSDMFGLAMRAKSEKADAAWILSVHDSAAEAAVAEALTWARFGLPGVRFHGSKTDVMDVARFWSDLGSNETEGKECLERHGLLADYPLWAPGTRLGRKSPFVTAAANMIDGFYVLPLRARKQFKGKSNYVGPAQVWEPVQVIRESYDDDIVSITVDDHHTYFADGILTHNSFTGAVDALSHFGITTSYPLTTSYRFGPAIQDIANRFLAVLSSPERVVGHVPGDTVGPVTSPDAVLTRTNIAMLTEIVKEQQAGRTVGVLTSTKDDLTSLVQTARAMKDSTELPEQPHEILTKFSSWDAFKEAGADSGDLQVKTAYEMLRHNGIRGLKRVVDALFGVEDTAALSRNSRIDVMFVTAHKAKGLEWDSVRIGDDFRGPRLDKKGILHMPPPEDLRLAYVAVTRAKKHLDPGSLAWVFDYTTANGESVTLM